MSPRLRLATRPELCHEVQACNLARLLYHAGECNLSRAQLRVLKDMEHYRLNTVVCRQCDEPDYVATCPNEALRLNGWGVPVIFQDECLLYGACQAVGPYNALFHDAHAGRYLKRDLCWGRDEGPVCAQVCPGAAIAMETMEVA